MAARKTADEAEMSPQKRGAMKRAAARAAAEHGRIEPVNLSSAAETVQAEHVLLFFPSTDEEAVLIVSRALRAVGREHSVQVTPSGYTLIRQA